MVGDFLAQEMRQPVEVCRFGRGLLGDFSRVFASVNLLRGKVHKSGGPYSAGEIESPPGRRHIDGQGPGDVLFRFGVV